MLVWLMCTLELKNAEAKPCLSHDVGQGTRFMEVGVMMQDQPVFDAQRYVLPELFCDGSHDGRPGMKTKLAVETVKPIVVFTCERRRVYGGLHVGAASAHLKKMCLTPSTPPNSKDA